VNGAAAPASATAGPSYSFRAGLAKGDITYTVGDTELSWTGRHYGQLPYRDIRLIRFYDTPNISFAGYGPNPTFRGFRRCVIHAAGRLPLALSSVHYLGPYRFEDRSATYRPFVEALIARVAATSPHTAFYTGMPAGLWLLWLAAFVVTAAVTGFAGLMLIYGLTQPVTSSTVLGLITAGGIAVGGVASSLSFWRLLRRNRSRPYSPGMMPQPRSKDQG